MVLTVQDDSLDRIWRLFVQENGTLSPKLLKTSKTNDLEKAYHQTVKKVTEDYEGLRFNTAISQMMVFINDAYKADELPKSICRRLCETDFTNCSSHCGRTLGETWSQLKQLPMKHGQHLMKAN